MSLTPSYEKFKELSDQQLIDNFNRAAASKVVGPGFYLDELHRRNSHQINLSIKNMTVAILVLTFANVALAGVAVYIAFTH